MTGNGDVLVVGGGISGMLTARELAAAGAAVTLVERNVTGRESSWAGGGILSPLHPWRYNDAVTALSQWGQGHYRQACDALYDESGVDPEWTCNGLLVVAVGEAERSAAERWAAAHGVPLERRRGEALSRCEPLLGAGFDDGLWLPEVAQLRNPRMLRALRIALERQGVTIREQTGVTGLTLRGGRVGGVETDRGQLAAERVVVSGGAWSAGLLDGLGLAIEVIPARGQMVLFQTRPGLLSRIVLHDGHYVIPRRDGRVLAGSTLEYAGFDKSTTGEALAELREKAHRLIPALGEFQIEHHWAGLRPAAPSGVPFIGPHPHVAGLYVNAGHFRNGVVLGLASARLTADLLLGRRPILDPAPYALDARREAGLY